MKEHIKIGWRTEKSIFQFLSDNIDNDGRLKDFAMNLPDQNRIDEDVKKLKFAPDFKNDDLRTYDLYDTKDKIRALADCLISFASYGGKNMEFRFYQYVIRNSDVLEIMDTFLKELVEKYFFKGISFQLARDLAFMSNHSNSVKFGIALLGLCNDKTVLDGIKILGLHDEFAVFAKVTVSRLLENFNYDDFKRKDIYSKLRIVKRLICLNIPIEITDWLILEFYKSGIIYEHLACSYVLNRELFLRTGHEIIDDKSFKLSGELIRDLITDWEEKDFYNYYEPPTDYELEKYNSPENVKRRRTIENYKRHAIKNYLGNAKTLANNISDFLILNQIKDFLEGCDDITDDTENECNLDFVSNSLTDSIAIINRNDWTEIAINALKSSDIDTYRDGIQASGMLNIDIWEIVWDKLQRNPTDSYCWFDVFEEVKEEFFDRMIELAIKTEVPKKGFVLRDEKHFNYRFLGYMNLFEYFSIYRNGYKGKWIVMRALNSPKTSHKNFAIEVLAGLRKENWDWEITEQIQKLRIAEQDQALKENIERLIKGEKLG
jgi:hypothetical protein